jgi:hypothetical protein
MTTGYPRTIAAITFTAAALFWLHAEMVAAASITLQNVPDFSQNEQPAWTNFCTPTAGTNIPYYFATTYPGLLAGQVNPPPSGPGTPADIGASKNIAGLAPGNPPFFPIANSLGGLMGTSPVAGTTLAGAKQGLDAYLEINDGNANVTWNTQILLADAKQPGGLGGANFWNALQQKLAAGDGILLAIQWTKDPFGNLIIPGSEYQIPNPYDPNNTGEEAAMGHSLTMVGYDVGVNPNTILFHDPANNPLIPNGGGTRSHVWPAVVADSSGVTINPNDLTIMIGPQGFAVPGIVYGAVVTHPVPEPCALALLGIGLAALIVVGVRRH